MQRDHHPNAQSREWALQFFYQCEIERLYFYSAPHLDRFAVDFQIDSKLRVFFKSLVEGVFQHQTQLNEKIEQVSDNWSLSRMPVIDRCILRIAAFELLHSDTPKRVVINEAIELAKKYSTENSAAFVNGILDRLASQFEKTKA
ncbi:MAG: transcription antitermination factor NusB [Proteobacteria bacterium]|nr:transcription antitermination factor NusB [Pseudomonadota bacterium]